jgi:uridine phosphorylase
MAGNKMKLTDADLILNDNGSIYHLGLLPEEISSTIITVGDPGRVAQVSQCFDSIELKKQKREFVTHTGYIGNKRLTVISTGIGMDNLDIVINEIDALLNINFDTRTLNPPFTPAQFIRLGTCGAIHNTVENGDIIISNYSLSFGNPILFYKTHVTQAEQQCLSTLRDHMGSFFSALGPSIHQGSTSLMQHFSTLGTLGHTATCNGFYGPQTRQLRLSLRHPCFLTRLHEFKFDNIAFLNYDMETGALHALSNALGHQACSLSVAVTNRITNTISNKIPQCIDQLIETSLEKICQL